MTCFQTWGHAVIEPHHNMIGADFGELREDAGSDPPSWPVLADHALYGVVRSIVGASTEESEADPTAVLATLLTHVGVFIGRGPFVRVGDDHHHARLFCAIVGQSTRGRKGTSEAPVRRLGEFADKRCGPLAWKPGPMSSGEGLIHAIRDGDGKADAGVADKRLLIVEGELADPLRAMQRNGNTLSTVLRATWDGRTLEPLTKANVIKVSNPHVGIVGHITIAEMKELLGRVVRLRQSLPLVVRSSCEACAPGSRHDGS